MIVEDHMFLRNGMEQTLKRIDFIKEIKQAAEGNEALRMLRQKTADVTLMDIQMPKGMNGYEAALKIKEEKINTKVIVCSMFDNKNNIDMMLHAGAMGFLSKNTSRDELEEAISTVIGGHYYFSKELQNDANDLLKEFETGISRKKERTEFDGTDKKIIDGIRKGKMEKTIADENNISLGTVKSRLQIMYRDFGVANAPELIDYLHRSGLMGF